MTARIAIAACLGAIALFSVAQPSAHAAGSEKTKKRKGMVVPAELATGCLEMKVKRHHPIMWPNRPVHLLLEFGPYQVVDYERGWTRSSSTGSGTNQLGVVSGNAAYGYHFRVVSTETPEAPPWSCECSAAGAGSTLNQSSESSEIRIPLSARGRLQCSLDRGDGSEPWRLDLQHGIAYEPVPAYVYGLIPACHATGRLVSGESVVTVEGTDRLAQYKKIGAQRITGFVLYHDERPVGAVDLFKPTVLIGPTLPEELTSAFIAASAALLLFEDLTQMPDER